MIDVERSGALMTVRLSGTITQADYTQVLEPAVEASMAEGTKPSVLAVIGAGFQGYDMAAAWEDTKLGLAHWNGFERIAVCSDLGWLGTAVRAMALFLPYPVKVFPLAEEVTARDWLAASA